MSDLSKTKLPELVEQTYDFRNTYIAHEKAEPLTNVDHTRQALEQWVETLTALHATNQQATRSRRDVR